MKGYVSSLVALALLLVPFAATGVASAAGSDRTQVIVEQGSTDRFGGGDWVRVSSGDASVAVLYGTPSHPNRIVAFAEYKRFLGGADVYDDQGNYLGTRGVPVYTIFGQSFEGLIEFRDENNDSLLDLRTLDFRLNSTDRVEKVLLFRDLTWTLTGPTVENASSTTYVNFTVGADNVPYDLVRPGTGGDGHVARIALTFHLKVDVHEITAEVPWYHVTVSDGTRREITHVERLDNKTLNGTAVAMGAKYDHLIEGWDFANLADPKDRLALETTILYGNYAPDRVVDFVHKAFFHGQVRDADGRLRAEENLTVADRPTLVTRDYIYIDDTWERVGRFVWKSDVTVDGRQDTMYFQIQGGARDLWRVGGGLFAGFHVIGAFIYPAGGSIFHDPGLDVVAVSYPIGTIANLTPATVLALQLAIVGIAVGPALWLRAKGRAKR